MAYRHALNGPLAVDAQLLGFAVHRETEADYLKRREQDELSLAIEARDPVAARLHSMLAEEYRARLASLRKADVDPRTTLITSPLSVDVVGGEVVLDGQLPVAAVMSPEAAIETGVNLVESGLKAESDSTDKQ